MKRKFRRCIKAFYMCIVSLAGFVTVKILHAGMQDLPSEIKTDFSKTVVSKSTEWSTVQSTKNSDHHPKEDSFGSINASLRFQVQAGVQQLAKEPEVLTNPKKVRIINEWKQERSEDRTTDSSDVILRLGHQRTELGFLTIGLSTVPRVGASYLLETIGSLLEAMQEIEKREVVIVIFLASLDENWVTETIDRLEDRFHERIEDGLILAIQPKAHIYPDFREITKTTYNDSLQRVHWRTKQNIDYAHLFSYCKNISKYYIHIEDDVTTANNFITDIKNYIFEYEKRTWFCIDFSYLGFIGKLFHSESLQLLSEFLLLFKEEMPCDLLLNQLKRIMHQEKRLRSIRSLFQHRGKISSLANKTQDLIDARFKDNVKLNLNRKIFKKRRIVNPPAAVSTNMSQYRHFSPKRAYIFSETDYFWAKSPSTGSYYTIEFDKPVNLTHIFVQTGHPDRGTDKLKKGEIKLGLAIGQNKCGKSVTIAKFVHGVVDINTWQSIFPHNINCVSIVVSENQNDWLIINEIGLY